VASVRRCIDCDAMLVDEVGPEGDVVASTATPLGAGDQIAYELDGWGNQLRVTLSGMLDLHGIAHVWEVGALVVAAPHEEAVDELIAALEGAEGEELDADVPQVAFEIEGVSADELVALDAELIAAHIPHAWQETGELLVPVESEDDVAAIIDEILNPPEEDEAEDGLATHAALDALYVAVDKLGKDPTDDKLVARYAAAADGLEGIAVPYGMAGNDWEALVGQVEELRALLEGTETADEANVDDATQDDETQDDETVEGAAPAITDAPEASGAEAGSEEPDDVDGAASDDADDAPGVDRVERAKDLIARLRARMLDLV
jgi:hypothetical protein